jgi:hypothetical protein
MNLAAFDNNSCIRPYKKNPRYWQYKGDPVLLLGGSKTDHIFLLDDLKAHLDEIAAAGGNYVRNTMNQRKGLLDLKPYKRLDSIQYDLDQWNPDFWNRFSNCLKWCQERGIIMQIEVFDRWNYSRKQWHNNPWRPANNTNYTGEQSGLADSFPIQPWRDKHSFFHTVPGMDQYRKEFDIVRKYQEKFVAKMLSYSLNYPNVLYCMNNETSTHPKWGRYWMKFIEDKAAEKGVEVFVSDMFDDAWKPLKSGKLRQAFDDPKTYEFIDISQSSSRNFNEDHWKTVHWLAQQRETHPRPLNCTKIYSDGELKWGSGTPPDGVERFWRYLMAGVASCRFHRDGAGIGIQPVAKKCIGAARKIEKHIKFWHVKTRMDLLSEREEDEAYLAADPGNKYILYFTDGGSVRLDLTSHKNKFTMIWVNIQTAEETKETTVTGGGKIKIDAPDKGGWAAVIVKK